jgi:peptidyl-prolyl cis-trans isomerase D
MVRRQLSTSLVGSEFALNRESMMVHELQQQTRDIRFLNVAASHFSDQVSVSEEQISAYYQENISQFDTEQKVSLAYVELTLDDLLPEISVTEQELSDYYQQNINEYRVEEERQASHILLESSEQDDSVLAKANEILAKAQSGEDFAELAKTHSADTFSAENGGDLGMFGKGLMDPAFEQATFAIAEVGQLSDVVKSEFGYHIIKLTDIKPEQVTSFEDVKQEVTTKVKTLKAEEEFYEIQQRIAEVAFEVPDSLEDVAAVANKAVKTTELFARGAAPQDVSNPKVVASAFSQQLIDEAVNSEVIELGTNHIMVIRVAQHEPERTKALDEVSEQVKDIIAAEASQQAAREWLVALQSEIADGQNVEAKLAEKDVAWEEKQGVTRNQADVSRTIVEAGFKLAENDLEVVDLVTGDVSLVQVLKVNQGEKADDTQLSAIQNQLASVKTQNLYAAMIESLKAEADIETYL